VSRGDLLLRLSLRSDPQMLCVVRSALAQLTEKLGFPESECRAIVLAVDEALANIIRHAYKGRPERPIEISLRRARLRKDGASREGLEIVLIDHGVAVEETKLRGRPLDELRPGGLGLHFIRQSMDTVEFRRSNGKNQLRLVKFFELQQQGQAC
jgi:serine/threonine-protein kinase RsbW